MTDAISYTFKIDDFTPDSMPFGRLVEYYAEIKKMLGVAENLHLVGVFKSSHGSAFAIDRNYESKLVKRLIAINEGTAPKTAIRAQSAINSMLKEDGTSGAFFDKQNHNIVQFPGKRADDAVLYRTRDAASFMGELYHISGNKDDVKARVSTDAYGVVFCTTTKEIGRALRDFLFENVKVSGRGMWSRSSDGKWDIDDFTITDFAPVASGGLRESVDRLRDIKINWPDDPIGLIREIEENGGGQVH
ncbi:hypothetical protein [Yunchengibacter salinarum]|uniref:hypothetical protein n=1 Tax=Yunchengibacter salinarum TaxID=3133399 RepID=UPI0035B663AC